MTATLTPAGAVSARPVPAEQAADAHLRERQVFTIRYGLHTIADDVWADKRPWSARHMDLTPVERHRCVCAGVGLGNGQCAQRMTQEDLRCDECREWCVQVDRANNFHPIPAVAS